MAGRPGIGEVGGQQYDIVDGIKSFLDQMSEGSKFVVGAAAIKELMQNADDAGARDLSIVLDERQPPIGLSSDYQSILQPALIVQNNAPFDQACFSSFELRLQLFDQMWQQVAKSLLFLKSLQQIQFGILRERHIEEWGKIEITPNPDKFRAFIEQVESQSKQSEIGNRAECDYYERSVTIFKSDTASENTQAELSKKWTFLVKHVARFDDSKLNRIRDRLTQNNERAVPWVLIAVPKDPESLRFDGSLSPAWRVFLPLLEEGPSGCVFNGAFFVGRSRQRTEFRSEQSDEALRKTEWNQCLVERGLIPLLQDASADILQRIPDLAKAHPEDYISLFPSQKNISATCLTGYFQQAFSKDWVLQLFDIWEKEFELWVGENDSSAQMIEMIPNWVQTYRDRFIHLATDEYHFVDWRLGQALSSRNIHYRTCFRRRRMIVS